MPFYQKRIEDAPPEERRVLEHIERILQGHSVNLAGTIAANVLMNIIFATNPNRDIREIDDFIDSLAKALKTGCREQLDRDKREGFH